MSVDREVVTRRLVSMRQLLDHLDTLDIRSPEVLDDMAGWRLTSSTLTPLGS